MNVRTVVFMEDVVLVVSIVILVMVVVVVVIVGVVEWGIDVKITPAYNRQERIILN